MEYKYIFFDLANTLVGKKLIPHIQNTLAQFDIHVEAQDLLMRHRMLSEQILFPSSTSRQFYDYFNSELLKSLNILPQSELIEAIFLNCRKIPWTAFEDAKIVQDITVPMGIISNWDLTLETVVIKHFGSLFSRIIGSETSGCFKPDPAIYRKAIEHLDCRPEEILYVGDSPKLDYYPAQSVGMTAILIDRDGIFPQFTGRSISGLAGLRSYNGILSIGKQGSGS